MPKAATTLVQRERTLDEQSLVRRIQCGDASAEAELIQLYDRRVLVMLAARTRDPDAARELAQETMIAVLRAVRAGAVRDPGSLPAFIHGVARNLANNHLRLRVRERSRYAEVTEAIAVVEPPATIEMRERIELLGSALRELPALDRRILLLTLTSGLNPADVGRRLGLSASIVRTRKSRAIRRLQQIVDAVTRSNPPVPPRS